MYKKSIYKLDLCCSYISHIFTKWIHNVMHASINKQPRNFQNCLGVLFRLCQGKGNICLQMFVHITLFKNKLAYIYQSRVIWILKYLILMLFLYFLFQLSICCNQHEYKPCICPCSARIKHKIRMAKTAICNFHSSAQLIS